MNPLEYIRRDAEGSDSDTRRRAAADLVKSLTERFPHQVTQLFTGYVQVLRGCTAAVLPIVLPIVLLLYCLVLKLYCVAGGRWHGL